MTEGFSGPAIDVSDGAPEQRRRGRGKKILIWVVAVIGVLVIGFGALVAFAIDDGKDELNQVAALQAGDCATVSGFGTETAEVVPVACTDQAANYTVGVNLPGGAASCPAGDYDVFQQTARIGADVTLCLIPKFTKGSCYLLSSTATEQLACKGSSGPDRIKVLSGTTEKAKCAKGTVALTFSQPASVYCFIPL
jgi:hypothetical protein